MKTHTRRMLLIAGAALTLLLLAWLFCTAVVPTGYTGIITTFGRVSDRTLDAGFHLKSPIQHIVMMDNREQKKSFTTQSFSSDIQQVDIIGSINYSINKSTAMTLYREVGQEYFSVLVMPRLLENTKAVFSKYTAENLVSAREDLSVTIRQKLSEEMSRYGINIISLSIENLDFTDSFTDAVEAKQVAAQKKLQAEIEQEQATMETRQAAERKKIAAQAEADVRKVEADAEAYAVRVRAEAEAEANSKISASLTRDLIDWKQATLWNGRLPTYIGGGASLPILDLRDTKVPASAEE